MGQQHSWLHSRFSTVHCSTCSEASAEKPRSEPQAQEDEKKATPKSLFDWGEALDAPSEQNMNEVVFQSWAHCKSKPSPAALYRNDAEEKHRREKVAWRKRTTFIELDCGEDSFFVSNNQSTIGVADGVGGWKDEGVDPADFSNTLMQYCKQYSEIHRDVTDPEVITQNAYDRILSEKKIKAGSSTACVASIVKEDQKMFLDVFNLGDSGLLVLRDRQMIYRVHEKVHGFNAPFQLGVLPLHLKGKAYCDRVSDGIRERIQVQEGDVVVMGTDGLFDNRFNSTLAEDVGWVGKASDSIYDQIPFVGGLIKSIFGTNYHIDYVDPYRVAQRQVQEAYKASMSKEGMTPWAMILQDFGMADAKGGKVDDITILISRVASRQEVRKASPW